MHECVHIHSGPGWIYSRHGGTLRRVETGEECERKRAKRALRRESTNAVRPHGPPKGLSRDRIFSISVRECELTGIRIKISRRHYFRDSLKFFKQNIFWHRNKLFNDINIM